MGLFKQTCTRCARERAFCICGRAPESKVIKRQPPKPKGKK